MRVPVLSNTFAPSGFQDTRRKDGAAWTGALSERKIAAANTHKIYRGDPVILLSTGYIDIGTPGSLPTSGVLGIFMGCEQQGSPNTNPFQWQPYYNGSATQDTKAYIIDDPMVVFRAWVGTGSASAAGGPATLADLNQNISFQYGSGSALSGLSGAYVDFSTVGVTDTLPFTIVGLVTSPPGVNGTDHTSAGNIVQVVLNQSAYKVGTTGV